MVVPLLFVSLTYGSASMGDVKKLGRIGSKALGFYLVTTAIAITIAIIMGIDRLLDMARTAINICGDAVCTTIIAKQEGELNEDIFNAKNHSF